MADTMAQLAAMNAEFDSIGVPGPSPVDKANNPFFQPDAAADNLSNRSSGIDFPSDQRLDDIEACIKDMLTTTQNATASLSKPSMGPQPKTLTKAYSNVAQYVNELEAPGQPLQPQQQPQPVHTQQQPQPVHTAVEEDVAALYRNVLPTGVAMPPEEVEATYGQLGGQPEPTYGVPGELVPVSDIGIQSPISPVAPAPGPIETIHEEVEDIYANELEGSHCYTTKPTTEPHAMPFPTTTTTTTTNLDSNTSSQSALAHRPATAPAQATVSPTTPISPFIPADNNPFFALVGSGNSSPASSPARPRTATAPTQHRPTGRSMSVSCIPSARPALVRSHSAQEKDPDVTAFLQCVLPFCRTQRGYSDVGRELLLKLPSVGVRSTADFKQIHRRPMDIDWRSLGAFGPDKLNIVTWSEAFANQQLAASNSAPRPTTAAPVARGRSATMPASSLSQLQLTQGQMVSRVEKELWYHGPMTRELAEGTLKGKRPGTFLIRISHNNSVPTLSLKTAQRFMHFKLIIGNGTVKLDGHLRTFVAIHFLVEHYSTNPLTAEGEVLKYPAMRRR